MNLEPPATHYLNAAIGWLGLGDADSAREELGHIPRALQSHPDVLEVRWQVSAKAQKWNDCVEIANRLVELSPRNPFGWIHRSYALHELKQTREALDALLPALTKFPKEWLIRYNLACYCCRLDQIDETMRFLEQACKLGEVKQVKEMARADLDLQAVWDQIAGI